jgi:hypothetical protein
VRSRFSSRTFRLYGSRSTAPTASTASNRKIWYALSPTRRVLQAPKLFIYGRAPLGNEDAIRQAGSVTMFRHARWPLTRGVPPVGSAPDQKPVIAEWLCQGRRLPRRDGRRGGRGPRRFPLTTAAA